ncbi:MAG TPA: sugar phosphate isomerase/epimerase, partial [Clostridia bacterium]|nr:sugar phosphate isomerase/epimerase [Clostridia bacterium]
MQVGAQTYTIREYTQTESGFRDAMRQLAQIGYRTVQLSAVGQIAPQTMREICDENGLTIVLTHTDPERML